MIAASLATVLLDAAIKVGAPIVKGVLQKHVRGAAGDVAGTVIDAIAGHAGVTPDELPNIPVDQLERAIRAAEVDAPALVLAHVESQKLANELQLAEMGQEEATWAWAWRPAWMWLLAFIWTYALVLRPLANAAAGAAIEPVDLPILMTLTGMYLALYMGGHTVKDGFAKWISGRAK